MYNDIYTHCLNYSSINFFIKYVYIRLWYFKENLAYYVWKQLMNHIMNIEWKDIIP
jgi:hypothetical protein